MRWLFAPGLLTAAVIPSAARNLLLGPRTTNLLRLDSGEPFQNTLAGVSNNLVRRVWQHREGNVAGFTKRYRIHRLVYYEPFRNVRQAIARETEIKKWRPEKKISPIEATNPTWEDLAEGWFRNPRGKEKADSSLRSE